MSSMKPGTKELRPYQVRLVTDVYRVTDDVLVEQPTGSGKTVQIVTLVAMHLGQRFTHAVISAPQEQIEQGFVKRDYQLIAFPDAPGVAVSSIEVPKSLINGARESKLGSVKRVVHYLRQRGPLDHAFACTHATLNRLAPEDLPADLSRKALFIDEAHHASADGLSQIVTLWRERGGQLFFFTATPYRGDGRPVRLDGMRAFRRSLAEHMAEGFAPRHLESEIVALGQPGDAITAGQFTGEEAPPSSYLEGLVAALCRRWREDDKPKTIVRVPPMQGGRSAELVARLIQALESQGASVLDATGTGAGDQGRFLTALEAEKSRTYAASAFDVMVGIQRVLEGTDWPVCGAVYSVGMPGSLNTVVQFLGRAMRLKGKDYPAAQRDRARLVFFVPCGGGAALADLSLDHSRHALLTCCFLADHEVGQEWIVLREVRRGIEAALGRRDENRASADAENEADEALDGEIHAHLGLVMAVAREQIVNSGREPTVGELVQLAAKTRPDLPETALHRVAVEILAAQTGNGAAVREAIHQEVARRLRINPMVKKAMEEAFAVVLEQFRNETLQESVVLESVRRQVHGVTGGQMREFAERLRPRPLSIDQILAWADTHHERTRAWPGQDSGPILDSLDDNWRNINNALRIGLRGLPGGSSLAQLLEEKRGVRNLQNLPPLTENQILAWADAHQRETGKWPRQNSGPIQDAPGETWSGISQALRLGTRGLPSGSSLALLLEEKRGVRNTQNLPPLTKEQILAWADEHHRSTGRWPTFNSGPILLCPCETWMGVQIALQKGNRGLAGGATLARLLAEERGVRNHLDLEPLTHDRILVWADTHFKSTGTWPKETSGPIIGALGETWKGVQVALVKGCRGLPGGSSLARLLGEERGVRNHLAAPPLTEKEILAWADAYHQQTGNWPTSDSGPVPGAAGETWSGINHALRRGSRGLPGGASLAQLLARERGVRNAAQERKPSPRRKVADLPALTTAQILVWADAHHTRTGDWPEQTSGPIPDAPAETWAGINHALRRGSRGLPGGSSLAELLQAARGVRNIQSLPPLTQQQILAWADEHHRTKGEWPSVNSGPIGGASGETWSAVNAALYQGHRELPGNSSLAQLLEEARGVRNRKNLPPLTENQILAWADAHHEQTGEWPKHTSGEVLGTVGERWVNIDQALRKGLRGLPGGFSLFRLIQQRRQQE
jgi:superfamily II DNA or RNA helicase